MVGTSRLKIVTNNDKLSFGCSLQADCFRDYYGFDKALPAFLQGECYDKRLLFKTESLMTGVRSRAARPAETSG